MKYHIKPLGMTKTQSFRQDLLWVWFGFIDVEITWALRRYDIELKSIFKKPSRFLLMTNQLKVAS